MARTLEQEFCTLRDTYIEKQFGRLNDMQRRAVFTTEGPLLIPGWCRQRQNHGAGQPHRQFDPLWQCSRLGLDPASGDRGGCKKPCAPQS